MIEPNCHTVESIDSDAIDTVNQALADGHEEDPSIAFLGLAEDHNGELMAANAA